MLPSCVITSFTFYYIYIKTENQKSALNSFYIFTFYYIYIKTEETVESEVQE